jgi:hypothetical protein
MGLDPSVELVQRADGNFYHIMVGDTQYKTLKVLHDHGADYLLSRAARTFKVKKVGDTEDNIYVLKDLWLEQDRKPEHRIYEEIIGDVGRLYPEQVDITRHLFTPVDHAFVEVNGIRDDTKTNMMRNKTLVSSKVVRLPIVTASSPDPLTGSRTFPKPSDKERDPIYDTMRHVRAPEKIRHRTHYRIVFKEYATPMHKVKKMGEVFAVLADMMERQSSDRFAMAKTLFIFFQLQCFVSFMGAGGCIATSALATCTSMKDGASWVIWSLPRIRLTIPNMSFERYVACISSA